MVKETRSTKRVFHHSIDTKCMVVQARLLGTPHSLIWKHFGVLKSTTNKWIKQWKSRKSLGRQPGSGRPRKSDSITDRLILRLIRTGRFQGTTEMCNHLKRTGIADLSQTTVRRRIQQSGEFASYWASRKPFIREANRKKRLQWCLQHRHWTVEQWARVIWTDESPFVLHFNAKRRVWRRVGERYSQECTVGTLKHDKKIQVWGCFASHGVGRLYRVQGILERNQFLRIMEHQFLPSAQALFPDGNYLFQQDNDPKHTAKVVKQFITDANIPILQDWPAQSPDLNPIENLWYILDRQCASRRPNNEVQLFNMIQDAWNNIPVTTLQGLVESMPRRIEAVIAAKGMLTKY